MLRMPEPKSVNVGAYTPRLTVVVAVSAPDVPVMDTTLWPTLAELLAVKVSVDVPVVGLGEKDAVTPFGKPETTRFTLPVKPYWSITST